MKEGRRKEGREGGTEGWREGVEIKHIWRYRRGKK